MAKSSFTINIDLSGIIKFKKNIKEAKEYNIEIGCIDDPRSTFIGAIHEFGSKSQNIPRRSFLVDPLTIQKKEDLIKYIRKEQTQIMKDFCLEKGTRRIYYKFGLKAKSIIEEAFETEGFGTWQPLKAATIKRKGHDKILIETGQLKKSIKFRTVKNNDK